MAADKLTVRHQIWRLLPPARRRAVLGRIAGWLAPRANVATPARSSGIIVAGELAQATGMGEAARLLLAGCHATGAARGGYALQVGGRGRAGALPNDAALLLAVNAPSIPLMLAREPRALLRGRRIIGAWAWELPVLPASWAVGARYVHEIWACSAFCAAACETMFPGRVRIVPYPLAMLPQLPIAATRGDFGLAADAVVTTMVFSLGSSFTRKNPLAAIAAFKAAFGARADRLLVVKFSGQEAFPAAAAAIRDAAGHAANIRLFSGSWPPARVQALLAASDIVLSLHRSEGFGLVPAQAMLRGKPVVATGWSGNMDYMDQASAALVNYRLVPMTDPTGVYGDIPGAVWAEPEVEHAAAQLRRLGDDPALRAALGRRGQTHAAAALDGGALRAALAANGIIG